jgi:hypothetical protein
MKMIVFKKGSEPGDVAINPALVTHVRSVAGPFSDIWFGPHRVTVEGSFRSVTSALAGDETDDASSQQRNIRLMR